MVKTSNRLFMSTAIFCTAFMLQTAHAEQALVQSVADKKLDGKDAVITAIMPGGLLYAGYKKVRYEQAKNELARVSTDIEEYSDDLLAMQPSPAQVIVAQLP